MSPELEAMIRRRDTRHVTDEEARAWGNRDRHCLLDLIDHLRAELDAVTRKRDEAKEHAAHWRAAADLYCSQAADGHDRGFEQCKEMAIAKVVVLISQDELRWRVKDAIRQLAKPPEQPAECSECDSGSLQPVERPKCSLCAGSGCGACW